MSLFYKATDKELLELRNKTFVKRGMPALEKNGFRKSPFSGSWFGRDSLHGYTYEFCRIAKKSRLDIVTVNIIRGEKWVQLYLNVFQLQPDIDSMEQLEGIDGIQFKLPPNSVSKMRLAPPKGLFFYKLPQHKVKAYASEKGLKERLEQLGDLIEYDLLNIDSFVERWLQEYTPLLTTWDGHTR